MAFSTRGASFHSTTANRRPPSALARKRRTRLDFKVLSPASFARIKYSWSPRQSRVYLRHFRHPFADCKGSMLAKVVDILPPVLKRKEYRFRN